MRTWTTLLPACCLALAVAGCGGGANGKAEAPADPLAGTAWTLDNLPGLALAEGVEVTVAFQEGRIGGSAGCNRYFASYEVHGDSLKLGPAGATKMMCPEAQMAAEDAFLAALSGIRTFRVADGRLVLITDSGTELGFAPAAPADAAH